MDIQEIVKYSKNKIEADDLAKQVRRRIKETAWEKQNRREGFTETFKPLISQFEKPEDSKKENIFTQNQKMLQNQLALTEGIKDNQKAITDGFSKFEQLANIKKLPGVEDIEDEEDEEDEAKIAKFNVRDFDRYLNKEAQDIIKSSGYYNLPSYYFDKNISEISSLIDEVNSDLDIVGERIKNTSIIDHNKQGYNLAKPLSKKPQDKTLEYINKYNASSIYSKNLNLLFMYKNKTGSGMFYFSNPEELLKRFELLGGSLAAGNNGVLPEYIQLAHRLRDLGIVTNNQLNKLLKNYINII